MKFVKKMRVFIRLRHFKNTHLAAIRLLAFFLGVIVSAHIAACIWILIAEVQDFSPDTWVSRAGLQDEDNFTIYLASLYWTFYSLLTIGYGNIVAVSIAEMLFATFWMILGGFFFSFTISNLASILSNMDTRESQINDKINVIT
jgi:hypothetical protein